MIKKYKKKPITIEALQWTGKNFNEMILFVGINDLGKHNVNTGEFTINTLEGKMTASVGDYVIKGIKGKFYPCKPDIFEETYEEVE